jgi:hypothetical protein
MRQEKKKAEELEKRETTATFYKENFASLSGSKHAS